MCGAPPPVPNPNKQVARIEYGPGKPKKHSNLPQIDIKMTPQDSEFDTTRFKNMAHPHPEEMPLGAIDICSCDNMVSAIFDINIGKLRRFDECNDVKMRRQLSEPFKVGNIWWMLGIEKILHSDDCANDNCDTIDWSYNDNDDSDSNNDDDPTIDIIVHLFCLSIKCDFDQEHDKVGHPIRMPIRRGNNIFSPEHGKTFGPPANFVRLPGSINFFIESGRSNGTRTIVLGGGNGLTMDGKQHYPLCATVLEDHHDYIAVVNSSAIKVGVEFVGNIPTISDSDEENNIHTTKKSRHE